MKRNFLLAASISGATAVALGAFGAHGLQRITTDEKILHGYQTAVQYQLYHTIALLAVAILYEKLGGKWMKWAGNCFIAGILLFSGSLYLLTVLQVKGSSAVRFVGPITPLGGLFFIAGWLCLFISVYSRKI